MTISGGGYNPPTQSPSFSPTPTIYERETTALESYKNRAEFGKGNVVILPQSQTDDITFTQQNNRNVWNYNSTASRPSLAPAGQLRGNAPALSGADEGWKEGYDALTQDLDPDLLEELKNPTIEETGTLQDVLVMGGRTMSWVDGVSNTLSSENAVTRAQANAVLPVAANASSLAQVSEMAASMLNTLDEAGPNAPFYGESKGFVDEAVELTQERTKGE